MMKRLNYGLPLMFFWVLNASLFSLSIRSSASIDTVSEEARGLEVATEIQDRDAGFEDYKVSGLMTLKSKSGDEVSRKFTMYTYEMKNAGDKRLVFFEDPKDVEGTVSLIHSHGLEPDDQWIYLPVLKRTKRLAARDKTGAFMGSEFTFEDISSRELSKYTYKYIATEEIDGNTAYKIEEVPAYPFSGYSKLHEWVDSEIYRPRKIRFFDQQDRPIKELTFHNYTRYADQFWRPAKIEMKNLQNGNESVIEWQDYQFGIGLAEDQFHPRNIKRKIR